MKYVRKNVALPKQQPVADAVITPVVTAVEAVTPAAPVTPTDDDDVDDLLGLGMICKARRPQLSKIFVLPLLLCEKMKFRF